MAAMVPGCSSAANCMASPRSMTSRVPSAKDTAPEATNAVYSPRLCPAQAAGDRPRRSTASRTTRLITKVASWALAVLVSSSIGASSRRALRSRPAISEASAATSHEGWSTQERPIPDRCDPCPGKVKASTTDSSRDAIEPFDRDGESSVTRQLSDLPLTVESPGPAGSIWGPPDTVCWPPRHRLLTAGQPGRGPRAVVADISGIPSSAPSPDQLPGSAEGGSEEHKVRKSKRGGRKSTRWGRKSTRSGRAQGGDGRAQGGDGRAQGGDGRAQRPKLDFRGRCEPMAGTGWRRAHRGGSGAPRAGRGPPATPPCSSRARSRPPAYPRGGARRPRGTRPQYLHRSDDELGGRRSRRPTTGPDHAVAGRYGRPAHARENRASLRFGGGGSHARLRP